METVPVPDFVVPVIVELLDGFVELQHQRFQGWTASTENPLNSWSELYRRRTGPLEDTLVDRIWAFVSSVLQILESNGAESTNISTAVVAWYWDHMLDEAYIKEMILELRGMKFKELSNEEIENNGLLYLDMIERTFLCGKFPVASSIIEAFTSALRGDGECDEENPLSAEVEDCIADVQRLLAVSFCDPTSFEAWQADANEQVYTARRVLGDVDSTTEASPIRRLAQNLRSTCLNILLAISGDVQLIRERCLENAFGFADYITALCAIVNPFWTVSELRDAVKASIGSWQTNDIEMDWDYIVVWELLQAEHVEDVVYAMQTICGKVKARLTWYPLGVERDRSRCDEEVREDIVREQCEDVALTDTGVSSIRYFALVCMAAHVGELCAPAFVSPSQKIELTFMRNDLLVSYVEMFAYNPRTWKVAGTYFAHMALLNPKALHDVVLYAARWAAVDQSFYHSLVAFCETMWDSKSSLQTSLRRQLEERLGEHPTLQQWFAALDFEKETTMKEVYALVIAKRLELDDLVAAAWCAVETDAAHPFGSKLKQLLRSHTALTNSQLYSIGAAVQNSFIQLDTCATVEMAHSMLACAGLFTYRRAAEALKDVQAASRRQAGPEATDKSQKLTKECIDSICIALRRINACDFAFHPLTVVTLVEHAADLLISIHKDRSSSKDSRSHVEVICRAVPSLLRDLCTCCLHHGEGLSKEFKHRVDVVKQKLACTLEIVGG